MNDIDQINPIPRFKKSKAVFQKIYQDPRCYDFYSTTHKRLIGFFGSSNITLVLTRGVGFRLRAGFLSNYQPFIYNQLFAKYGINKRIWVHYYDKVKEKGQILFNFCDLFGDDLATLFRAFKAELPNFNYSNQEMSELYMRFHNQMQDSILDHPVYATSHPSIFPLDVGVTSDGKAVLNAIYGLANDLKIRYREELDKYYHPMIFQTQFNADAEKKFHPPMAIPMPNISPQNVNPNIYDSVDFLAARSKKKPVKRDLDFGEYLVALDNIRTSVPVDDYGWPLDVEPPKMELENLCANGPKATAGGVAKNGKRSLKTSVYFSTVDYVFRLVKKAEDDVKSTGVIDLPMMPYLLSPKAEVIKKNKKARNFTVIDRKSVV